MTRLLTAGLIAALASPALADNWPQWRGPKNDGHSAEKGIPAEFGDGKNVVWKAPMPGVGSSTPCVWGDHIFLTAQEGPNCFLLCYGTDGKERWRRPMGTGKVFTRADEGGNLATPSPTTDGKHVFAFDGSGFLGCFDPDGKEVWKADIQKYGKFAIQFGVHWTPVLYKGRLYLQVLHRNAQIVLALDAATGKEIWKVERASDSPPRVESPDVYASAFVWEKGDQALLIAHGNDYCTAHKLDTGEEVGRVTELNPKARYNRTWRAVASPLVTPDLIVVPSCKHIVTVGINPVGARGIIAPGNPNELWRIKDTPDVPSPLLVDGVVYLMGETGTLHAVDAKTGKTLYSERVTNQRHRPSPVFVDGKIILVSRDGTVPVVKPGREFELIAKNKVPDTFTASPALADGRLYLRGWNYLWAIGTK